jgi:hypothetical protein
MSECAAWDIVDEFAEYAGECRASDIVNDEKRGIFRRPEMKVTNETGPLANVRRDR